MQPVIILQHGLKLFFSNDLPGIFQLAVKALRQEVIFGLQSFPQVETPDEVGNLSGPLLQPFFAFIDAGHRINHFFQLIPIVKITIKPAKDQRVEKG